MRQMTLKAFYQNSLMLETISVLQSVCSPAGPVLHCGVEVALQLVQTARLTCTAGPVSAQRKICEELGEEETALLFTLKLAQNRAFLMHESRFVMACS